MPPCYRASSWHKPGTTSPPKNGRWWLIDPSGNRCLHIAVVGLYNSETPGSRAAYQKKYRSLADWANQTNDQLRALAANGGVAQCTFYAGFLRTDDENATIDDTLRHLLHMISVAGIDHVGIGTDFDGDGGVPGLANASELIQLTRRLQAEGFTDEDLAKIWGGNFLRVMTRVQAAAQG